MPNKKKSTEDVADKAVAKAKAMKEVSEQNVRKQLMESFAPQLKKMISQSILEMEDDEEFDLEETEDEFDDEEVYEEEDEIDPEELEDLENALEEEDGEGDDEDGDGHVEVPTDEVPEEEPEEVEDLEEGSDDYEELEEESDEDFLAELKAILEEEEEDGEEEEMEPMEESSEENDDDEEVIEEVEGKKNGDSYEQDAPPEGAHTKKYESTDGGSYTDDSKETSHHTKKYEAVVKENRRLKEALKEINNSLNESVLDEYKTQKFKSIVESRKLTETAKLKVMRAIDEGKSEREVDRITSVFESTLPKSSKKKSRLSESTVKGGRNSSIRKPKSKKKNLNESASSNKTVGYEWANRLAHLADV